MSKGVTTDAIGLAGVELNVINYNENGTINTAEAPNERGDFIARETFEALTAPSNEYTVCADYDLTGFTMGTLIAGPPALIINAFTATTAGGDAPTLTVASESVPTGSAESYTYTNPAGSILADHEAQILFGAFVLTALEDCYVQSCSATGQANISRGLNEDGETCGFDIQGATIEVTAEINQADATVPTVTPAADWTVTSPLTETQTNTDYTTYSITLRYTPAAVAPTP